MLPVDFKKWQCPLSIFLNVPVDFKEVQCRLLNLRKCHVALSNLRVKCPNRALSWCTPSWHALCGSRGDFNPVDTIF